MLAFIGAGFQSLLVESRRLTYAESLYLGETARFALVDHQRILAAIERRDSIAAGEAMQAHLSMTHDTLVTAYERLRLLVCGDEYQEKGNAQPALLLRLPPIVLGHQHEDCGAPDPGNGLSVAQPHAGRGKDR